MSSATDNSSYSVLLRTGASQDQHRSVKESILTLKRGFLLFPLFNNQSIQILSHCSTITRITAQRCM